MKTTEHTRMTSPVLDTYLVTWLEAFLTAKRAAKKAKNTILFYTRKLQQFNAYCEAQQLTQLEQLTPAFLREYLLHLENTGHNAGGEHAAYRAIRVFLLWYESEAEPDGWRNPIHKVQAPQLVQEPLDAVPVADVLAMVKHCQQGTFSGDRDAALLLCLLDTGCRAREFLAINIQDVQQATGAIIITHSKSRQPRYVYLGSAARKALRRYLRHRADNITALWITKDGERLAYSSLRDMVVRRAKLAEVPCPSLHSFRRAFAINYLLNNGDVFTLQKLMGHADLSVLRRYLKLTDRDLQQAHAQFSPIDNLKG